MPWPSGDRADGSGRVSIGRAFPGRHAAQLRSGSATPIAMNTPPQAWLKRRPTRASQGLMRCAMLAMNSSVAISISGERSGHDDELHEQAARRVDELRQKGGEEQQPLRVGQRRQRPLRNSDQPAARLRRAAHFEADRRRAPDLDAEPDEVGAAHPLHDRQPHQRGLQQRADAEHRKRDDGDEAAGAAEDGVQRLAPAVQRAMRQRQQPVRSGRERQPDGCQQVDEPGVEVHGLQC